MSSSPPSQGNWLFVEWAKGLVPLGQQQQYDTHSGPPPPPNSSLTTAAKENSNDDHSPPRSTDFGLSTGISKPSSALAETSKSPTFVISSHAFSARAAQQQQSSSHTQPTAKTESDGGGGGGGGGDDGMNEITLRVRVTHDDHTVLIGLGPASTQLNTPLTWEEPAAYFVECSAKGLFLWSEAASIYGQRISDKCLIPTKVGLTGEDRDVSGTGTSGGSLEGNVRMRWNYDQQQIWFGNENEKDGAMFAIAMEEPTLHEPKDLLPIVTLLNVGDQAEIVCQ